MPAVVMHHAASLQAPLWCECPWSYIAGTKEAGARLQPPHSDWNANTNTVPGSEEVYASSSLSARDQEGFPPQKLSRILRNQTSNKGSEIADIILRIITWTCLFCKASYHFVRLQFTKKLWLCRHSSATCDKQALYSSSKSIIWMKSIQGMKMHLVLKSHTSEKVLQNK